MSHWPPDREWSPCTSSNQFSSFIVDVTLPSGLRVSGRSTFIQPLSTQYAFGVGIDVDDLVIAEIDRVRARRKRAAVEIGIEHLVRERDPAAGRSARQQARPRLANHAELRFDGGNQLLHDRVAVRSVVLGVHAVRVVVVRRRMLQLDGDHARRGRRLRAPAACARLVLRRASASAARKMPLVVDDRVLHVRDACRSRPAVARSRRGRSAGPTTCSESGSET